MTKHIKNNIKTIIFFVLLFSSCDNSTNPVPNVYVDIYINLSDPQYYDLQTIGGYVYITGGVAGILVYKSSSDEYRAYDRVCPYDIDCGKVFVEDGGFNAADTLCCGSEFSLLLDGAVAQGPAEYPLKQYNCIYDKNSDILHIKN